MTKRKKFQTLSAAIDHATAQLEAATLPGVRWAWRKVLRQLERDIDLTPPPDKAAER